MSTPVSYTPPPATRPLGVAILAVLVGIFGVLLAVGGALLIAGAAALSILGIPATFAGIGGVAVGVVVLVIGLIILGLALGLWHLRMWALVLTLLFVIVELVSYGLAGNFISLGFIFALILFVYLLAVRRHFR
jgi:hypothetical protein